MSNCPECQDWPRAANFSPQVPELGADTEAVLQLLAIGCLKPVDVMLD